MVDFPDPEGAEKITALPELHFYDFEINIISYVGDKVSGN